MDLSKPILYVLLIIAGAVLKKVGFFKAENSNLLAKIMMNFTLPASIVVGFSNFERDTSLFLLIPIGLFAGIIPLIIAFWATKKLPKEVRAYYMLNLDGRNIGCFGLPVLQTLFGPAATVLCCMFDIGNAINMVAGNYAMTTTMLDIYPGGAKKRINPIVLLCQRMFSSFCLDVYLTMMVLMLLNIKIPSQVGDFLSPIANANAFIAMLMVGILFEFHANKDFLSDIVKLVLAHLGFSVLLALFMYFALPFDLEYRKILVLLSFSPIGAMCSVFTVRCGGSGAKASCANSISVLCGIVVMVAGSVLLF
ncbi:MAG: AEC family transporter [Eubacterium sp.]|nr:AEC family transporter [Eubacterium sp.]